MIYYILISAALRNSANVQSNHTLQVFWQKLFCPFFEEELYSTSRRIKNWYVVTKINFAKSKNVVCDKCSVSLESMKCLKKHMKDKHNDDDDDDDFYCSDHCQLTYRPGSQDAIATKNEMIYNLLYLYVLRKKIRLDRTLLLLIRCLVVTSRTRFT